MRFPPKIRFPYLIVCIRKARRDSKAQSHYWFRQEMHMERVKNGNLQVYWLPIFYFFYGRGEFQSSKKERNQERKKTGM